MEVIEDLSFASWQCQRCYLSLQLLTIITHKRGLVVKRTFLFIVPSTLAGKKAGDTKQKQEIHVQLARVASGAPSR